MTHLPPPPAARVITLSKPGYFSEPSVAIDPQHPSRAVAVYQVGGYVAYTRDGGRTWQRTEAIDHAYGLNGGDVSVTYDARGRAQLCYISFDRLGTDNYWAHDAKRNGIFTLRSLDGGKTWLRHEIAVVRQPAAHGIFEDKPYIVADDTHSKYRGNLYVGWTQFSLRDSEIHFSRSTDGGASWSPSIRISTQNGAPRDDNGNVEGFDGAVAPDGALDVVWGGGTSIFFTQSRDGGRTFAPSRPIVALPASYYGMDGFAGRGGNGFPQIAIDPRTRKLYVSWSDYRNGEIDVFTSVSRDGGKTWQPPVKVNTDPAHDGRDHFFSWMTVDPVTGDVYVVFADRRNDPRNIRYTFTLARSTDGGRTYRNFAWTRVPTDPRNEFMGDYTGIAAYGGNVFAAWTQAVPYPKHAAAKRRMPHTVVRLGIARFRNKSAS